MGIIKTYKTVIKASLSCILLLPGVWLLTEAVSGPYLVYLNSRLAIRQGIPYKSSELILQLSACLVPLLLGIAAIWFGIKLWKKWKIPLGSSFAVLGLVHLVPENPMGFAHELFGEDLFTCQVNCQLFGTIYLLLGAGLIFWFFKTRKSTPKC